MPRERAFTDCGYLFQSESSADGSGVEAALGMACRGQLHPVIGKVFPLAQTRDGYILLQEGKNYGKIVLKLR